MPRRCPGALFKKVANWPLRQDHGLDEGIVRDPEQPGYFARGLPHPAGKRTDLLSGELVEPGLGGAGAPYNPGRTKTACAYTEVEYHRRALAAH